MAILKNGLMGGITGKLGNTTCYMLNGKQVVRMIVKSTKPPSEKQLINRAEMVLVNALLKPFIGIINIGFGLQAKMRHTNPYSLAVGYQKRYALKGDAPNREIDFEKVMIGIGDLPGIQETEVVREGHVLRLTWSPQCVGKAKGSDVVLLLAYLPAAGTVEARACFDLCGTERSAGGQVLELPEDWSGRALHAYVLVASVNGKNVSNSKYLGSLS